MSDYVPASRKGARKLDRKPRKRGGVASKRVGGSIRQTGSGCLCRGL